MHYFRLEHVLITCTPLYRMQPCPCAVKLYWYLVFALAAGGHARCSGGCAVGWALGQETQGTARLHGYSHQGTATLWSEGNAPQRSQGRPARYAYSIFKVTFLIRSKHPTGVFYAALVPYVLGVAFPNGCSLGASRDNLFHSHDHGWTCEPSVFWVLHLVQ